MIEDDNRNQNPQDGSVGVERRPNNNNRRTLMAKASLFEQQQQQPTIGTGKMKRKVMPKSRRTSMPPSAAAAAATHHHPPEPSTNRDKAPVSPSKPGRPKARASPRRQTIASTTSTTNTNRAQLMNQLALLEDGAESLSSTEAETDSQDLLVQSTMAQIAPPPHNKLSPAIKRASILQQFQKQRLEEMKKKREEEAHRLERIKQGRRIQNIRSSVDNYDKTIEKNKQYGFDKGCSPKKKAPPKRRITDVEAAKAAEAMEHHDITETEVELDEDDEQSITLDQILPKNIHKTTPTRPQRHESKESTLSPIRVPTRKKPSDDKEDDVPDDTSSIATEDLPVPKIINVVESSSMDDSEISLSSSIRPKSRPSMLVKEESSRWEAEPAPCPKKKMSTSMLDQDPVVWNPVPALLKAPATEPNSRWAVHPRVVYGKPKTEKAVQPAPGRWAATGAPARKKKVFPRNESRWAAQPKKKAQQLPENGSRLPRRQATKDGTNGALILPCNKPRRQATKEDLPTKQQRQQAQAQQAQQQAHAPRRGRRRQSMMDPQPAGATTVVTAPAATTITTTTTTKEIQEAPATTTNTAAVTAKEETTKAKLLSRTLSLGEVKKIHAATRIQATLRMYKERYQYKMMQQQQRKDEIQAETQQELQEIRDNLMKRQESLRARMERDAQAGVVLSDTGGSSSSNGSVADASLPSDEKELKRQIAELEKSNAKLQSQCDRLRGSNSRMQSGNKTREAALKEVNGRLSKLQHIQKKLNKVKQEFQNEYSTIEQELKDTNAKLQTEVALQETTKACFRQIVVRMRANQSDLSKGFADLTLEVEDMVPIDCLP